ncbi:MAG: BMP family ABC transporter substrate-binding protein, partial [Chloroflexi bacterium]|nr:BMP family ABC transporter substrate-binding protein [Chloroflexota bacterium]
MALLTACGGAPQAQSSEAPAAEQKPFKVGLLSPGPVNDQGWNQTAYDALKRMETELGAEISYVELADSPSDFEKAFRDYASQGYQM